MFAGGVGGGGAARQSMIDELRERYGGRFTVVNRFHQKQLADMIASHKIVIAPDSPITHDYWSNRVYLTLGFGGFLLHPRCRKLEEHYTDGKHLVMYEDRDKFWEYLNCYLGCPRAREEMQRNALQHTWQHHTYKHRCERLISIVKQRLELK